MKECKWRVEQTGPRSVLMMARAMGQKWVEYQLLIRYENGELDFSIDWRVWETEATETAGGLWMKVGPREVAMDEEDIKVTTRIGAARETTRIWKKRGEEAHHPAPHGFVKRLMKADRLVAWVRGQKVTFNTTGLANTIKREQRHKSCGRRNAELFGALLAPRARQRSTG